MTNCEPSDGELVTQTLAGDLEAFGQLYDRHVRLVRAVVCRVSLDWASVAEMSQESFLRAYENLGRLKDRERFGAWVVGIGRQVGHERRRSVRRDRRIFRSEISIESAAWISSESQDDSGEDLERLMQTVMTLPEREQLVIHAFFWEKKDIQRTAELLNLSRSGCYALLKRALAHLSKILQPLGAKGEVKK